MHVVDVDEGLATAYISLFKLEVMLWEAGDGRMSRHQGCTRVVNDLTDLGSAPLEC
jgi:hypothetical protein